MNWMYSYILKVKQWPLTTIATNVGYGGCSHTLSFYKLPDSQKPFLIVLVLER